MLGSPLGFLLPTPCLAGAGPSLPRVGGCCAPVAVAEHWERHPAPLAPSQMFPAVGIAFSPLEVAVARGLRAALLPAVQSGARRSGMPKGRGWGWGYGLLSTEGVTTNLSEASLLCFPRKRRFPCPQGREDVVRACVTVP